MNGFSGYDEWVFEGIKHMDGRSYEEVMSMLPSMFRELYVDLQKFLDKYNIKVKMRYGDSLLSEPSMNFTLNDIYYVLDYTADYYENAPRVSHDEWIEVETVKMKKSKPQAWGKSYTITTFEEFWNKALEDDEKKMNEGIKHLKGRSREEIIFQMKNSSPDEKLMAGVTNNIIELVKDGIKNGARIKRREINPMSKIETSMTYLDIAKKNGFTEIVDLIENYLSLQEGIKHLPGKSHEEVIESMPKLFKKFYENLKIDLKLYKIILVLDFDNESLRFSLPSYHISINFKTDDNAIPCNRWFNIRVNNFLSLTDSIKEFSVYNYKQFYDIHLKDMIEEEQENGKLDEGIKHLSGKSHGEVIKALPLTVKNFYYKLKKVLPFESALVVDFSLNLPQMKFTYKNKYYVIRYAYYSFTTGLVTDEWFRVSEYPINRHGNQIGKRSDHIVSNFEQFWNGINGKL